METEGVELKAVHLRVSSDAPFPPSEAIQAQDVLHGLICRYVDSLESAPRGGSWTAGVAVSRSLSG